MHQAPLHCVTPFCCAKCKRAFRQVLYVQQSHQLVGNPRAVPPQVWLYFPSPYHMLLVRFSWLATPLPAWCAVILQTLCGEREVYADSCPIAWHDAGASTQHGKALCVPIELVAAVLRLYFCQQKWRCRRRQGTGIQSSRQGSIFPLGVSMAWTHQPSFGSLEVNLILYVRSFFEWIQRLIRI